MLAKIAAFLLPLMDPALVPYIERNALDSGIDPLLVLAIIKVESNGRATAISPTHDYGLMQLHVSGTTNPKFRTSPRRLLDPRRNIRIGIRALRTWKRYHDKRCGIPHHWIGHYNQGTRVRSAHYARAVRNVLRNIRARFRTPGEV